MGNGNATEVYENTFNFSETAVMNICGAPSGAANIEGLNTGLTVGVPVQLKMSPAGGTFTITPSDAANVSASGVLTVLKRKTFTVKYAANIGGCDTFFELQISVGDISFNIIDDFNAGVIKKPIPGNVSTNDRTPSGATVTYGTPTPSGSVPTGSTSSNTTLTMNTDGSYTFTTTIPGVYTYDVPVCVSGESTPCPTTKLVITVTDPTGTINPPHANLDLATTKADQQVTVDLRANDKPGNTGGTLGTPTIPTSGNPKNGTASINGSGNLVYKPNTGFTGKDTVTYEVCESPSGLCKTAMAIITVLPDGTSDYTDAADDLARVPINTTASGNVKSNDVDPLGRATKVTPQTKNIPGKGDLTLNEDGSYTFVPVTGFVGTVDIPYETYVDGAPTTNAEATLHIVVYNTDPLSVRFGTINARWIDGQLVVEWTTMGEKNNSLFEVEVSKDGVNFTKIGEVLSKAKDGNSTEVISYDFAKSANGMGVAGLAILGLAIGAGLMRRRKLMLAMAVVSLMLIGYSCNKNKDEALGSKGEKMYVRIAQVNKDGSKSYSKVVQVVKE